jgi:Tfp pilus assembly protein PilN
MNIFSMDFTLPEITFLRQSLDLVTIKGTDAKFLAGLQIKLEHELAEIQRMIEEENTVKVESFKQIQQAETNKNTSKK